MASGLNALAAVTVEDFAPLVVQHISTERETLVSKLLGICNRHISIFCFINFLPQGSMAKT